MGLSNLRGRIGRWASDKSFAYYKNQTDANGKLGSYLGLPRYIEVLVNWGYSRNSLKDSLRYRWVIR
jgi:hypothetical protein